MHLFTIILLYIGTGSFLALLFQYINTKFPDPLNIGSNPGPTSLAISILIVVYPVFLWASSFIKKDIKTNPHKAELKTRKWLLYFTLFAAAGFIIGDLVTLIYNFLNGEVTVRFILKVLAILVVAAAIFWYYLSELRSHGKESAKFNKSYAWITTIVVVLTITSGFFITGSPFTQRTSRLDEQKIYDLQSIQGQVLNYWIRKNELPASLSELENPLEGYYIPKDTQTGEAYKYSKINNLTFEICATFNRSSDNNATNVYYPGSIFKNENWAHGAGENCFKRTIDPSLYENNAPNIKR